MSTPRKTSMIEKPNQPRFLNTVAHGHTKSNSMSKMMKKMAMVENLMAKRPSGRATGSLPHSNGSILTREGRRGAMRAGIPRRAPPTRAETANTIKIGTYSILSSGGERPPLLAPPPPPPLSRFKYGSDFGRQRAPRGEQTAHRPLRDATPSAWRLA